MSPSKTNEQALEAAIEKVLSTKIDQAIALQERQIAKLKATLIDGAVTGKARVC